MILNAAQVLLGDHDAQRVALICGAERLTFGDLRDRVARCASAWQQQGLVPGDRVAIKLPDGIDSVCTFLGANGVRRRESRPRSSSRRTPGSTGWEVEVPLVIPAHAGIHQMGRAVRRHGSRRAPG